MFSYKPIISSGTVAFPQLRPERMELTPLTRLQSQEHTETAPRSLFMNTLTPNCMSTLRKMSMGHQISFSHLFPYTWVSYIGLCVSKVQRSPNSCGQHLDLDCKIPFIKVRNGHSWTTSLTSQGLSSAQMWTFPLSCVLFRAPKTQDHLQNHGCLQGPRPWASRLRPCDPPVSLEP